MLLAHGQTIYFDDACKAVDHFSSIGYSCPELSNPSDYFMAIMSIESIETPDIDPNDLAAIEQSKSDIKQEYETRIEMFYQAFQDSKMHDSDSLDASLKSSNEELSWKPPGVSWCR